jgi:tRNA-Thr(GGU) m(6)t(6)A37 methyltransferase TsaA
MPIQPSSAAGALGYAQIAPRFVDGLRDLDGFSHLILLYHFHLVQRQDLIVTPFLDHSPHGIFATRAPTRPNPIGLSVVELVAVDGATLHLRNVDFLDGTPLLDIKPYVPAFDHPGLVRTGWLSASPDEISRKRSDDRFS